MSMGAPYPVVQTSDVWKNENEALLGIGWDRVQYLDVTQRDEILGQRQLTRYGIFRPSRMSVIVKKRKT